MKNIYKIVIEIKSKINFAFKVNLQKEGYFYNKSLDQGIIGFEEKFIFFYEVLEKYGKLEYKDLLIEEGINLFKDYKSFEFFILLYSYCYDKKYIYALFNLFHKEFVQTNKINILIDLNSQIGKIYNNKNKIFQILIEERKKEKKGEVESKKNNISKEGKENNDKNIFYFILIYYYI